MRVCSIAVQGRWPNHPRKIKEAAKLIKEPDLFSKNLPNANSVAWPPFLFLRGSLTRNVFKIDRIYGRKSATNILVYKQTTS